MGCLQNKYRDTKLTDMEILALKDKHVLPTPEVLNSVLHDSYPAFEEAGTGAETGNVRGAGNLIQICRMGRYPTGI